MLYTYIIITTLVLWCARNVLPLFYPPHPNTMPLTYYISHFYKLSNESRRNHTGKTAGLPENKGPPRIYRGFAIL
jgi:hypothetical protein